MRRSRVMKLSNNIHLVARISMPNFEHFCICNKEEKGFFFLIGLKTVGSLFICCLIPLTYQAFSLMKQKNAVLIEYTNTDKKMTRINDIKKRKLKI